MPESQNAEQGVTARAEPSTTEPSATGPSSERPPFRADHVGSLLRPPEVLRARNDFAAGRIGADKLRGVEDAAIREVVRRQEEVGLRSVTDGEFRRESWHMDFIYQLGGIQKVHDDTIRVAFHNDQKTYEWAPPSAHVVAPLRLEHTIFGDAYHCGGEAHDPVAEHGALPRRPLGDRRVGVPRPGPVLDRPRGRLRR
jgi:5-methyltetrahydropteroyltriglutamate--homocysteine methyltransferase